MVLLWFWLLQDRMMMELHSQGVTMEQIEEVLKRIPIHPRIVPAIKAAHALGYALLIWFPFCIVPKRLSFCFNLVL